MAMKVWLGDRLVDEADAKISVFDHGLLYGDGVFEGIRMYNGRVFRLEESKTTGTSTQRLRTTQVLRGSSPSMAFTSPTAFICFGASCWLPARFCSHS